MSNDFGQRDTGDNHDREHTGEYVVLEDANWYGFAEDGRPKFIER